MAREELRVRLAALFAPVGRLSPRRELIMVLLILAESMIVYIYAGVLFSERNAPYDPVPLTLIFTLLLVAYQIPHLLETIRIWTPEYELIMVAGLAGTLLLVLKVGAFPHVEWYSLAWVTESLEALIMRPNDSVRPVWGMVLLIVYAWWRGRSRAEPVIDSTYGMLRWGLVFAAGALTLSWLSSPPGAAISETISAAVVGFIVVALLAIAVARQPASSDSPEWHAAWIWLALFVLPILAIAATTVSTAGVLSRETLDLILSVLEPAFWLLGLALQAIILFIAVLTFILIAPILWFIDRQNFGPFSNMPRIDLAPRTTSDIDEFARTSLNIADPVRFLVVGLILTLLGWLLVRFLFRRRRYWQEGTRQQRESLIEWEAQPATLIQRAGEWLSTRFRVRSPDPRNRDPRWNANQRIRRVYRAFLRLAGRQGIVRSPGSTPSQFARQVSNQHEQLGPSVDEMTARYNQARYSGQPLPDTSAHDAEEALASVKTYLNNLKRS